MITIYRIISSCLFAQCTVQFMAIFVSNFAMFSSRFFTTTVITMTHIYVIHCDYNDQYLCDPLINFDISEHMVKLLIC